MSRHSWLTPDEFGEALTCLPVWYPNDSISKANLLGAIVALTKEYNWEKCGDCEPEDLAEIWQEAVFKFGKGFMLPVGSVFWYAGTDIPDGTLVCNGADLCGNEYPALFAAIGVVYGSSSSGRFNLPNLERRGLIGPDFDSNYGVFHVGDSGGAEAVELETMHLPGHEHGIGSHVHAHHKHAGLVGVEPGPVMAAGPTKAGETSAAGGGETDPEGGNEPFSIMNPFVVMTPLIVAR